MKTLKHSELIELLEKNKGTLIVGLQAYIDARSRKTNNPYFPITKEVRAVGFVGVNYENSVNREANRQDCDPVFRTEQMKWGKWQIFAKLIKHKDSFYLRTQTTPGQRNRQPAKLICYRDKLGQFLNRETARQFLPPVEESGKQQRVTGINKTVWVRTYKFDNIKKLRVGGETYLFEKD